MPQNQNDIDMILFGLNEEDYDWLDETLTTPKSLRDLVSNLKNSLGNNILQQLVLDSSVPNKCSENYMISVLFSISDSALVEIDEDGFIPFHVAVKQMNLPMVEMLLTRLGNRIDINVKHLKSGRTALHLASEMRGGQDMISLLISKGADVNARDHTGRTPIFDAAHEGNIENMRVLVKNGADVNATDYYKSSPLYSIGENQINVAIFLINKGANVRNRGTHRFGGDSYHPNHLLDMLLN